MVDELELKRKIQHNFKTYAASHPKEVVSTAWVEAIRDACVEGWSDRNLDYMGVNEQPSLQLNGAVYVIGLDRISMMIATYNDDTVLWLDDPSNNFDFTHFIQREDLQHYWLDDPDSMAELLVETKFRAWMRPQLIRNAHDIPQRPEESRNRLLTQGPPHEQEGFREMFTEMDARLDAVSDQIIRPIIRQVDDRNVLEFYIWTKEFGYVFGIRCTFALDGRFEYEAVELANQVGYFLIPR